MCFSYLLNGLQSKLELSTLKCGFRWLIFGIANPSQECQRLFRNFGEQQLYLTGEIWLTFVTPDNLYNPLLLNEN